MSRVLEYVSVFSVQKNGPIFSSFFYNLQKTLFSLSQKLQRERTMMVGVGQPHHFGLHGGHNDRWGHRKGPAGDDGGVVGTRVRPRRQAVGIALHLVLFVP